MVTPLRKSIVRWGWMLTIMTVSMGATAGETEPLLQRLDPQLRARVMMALLGLVLVGLALITSVVMGARYLRRMGRTRSTHEPATEDDWFAKPLVPPDTTEREQGNR